MAVVRNILARPDWPFPELTAVIETPALKPNGSFLIRAGYDRDTGLFYEPTEVAKAASSQVPDRPTIGEIRRAAEFLLTECLGDFPFADEASRANALALMLTAIVRPAVECVPLAIISSPAAGAGKGLLSSVISLIVTGREVAKGSMPEEGPELRKSITSRLLSQETFAVFDNVDTTVRSSHLAALLTTTLWSDRLMGESRQLYLPNQVVWIATGNKMRTRGDMERRCFSILLKPDVKIAWLRKGFRHPELRSWVAENRTPLLAALLTLVQGYVVLPPVDITVPILGSFEPWCRIVGKILLIAGVRGFLSDCVPSGPSSAPQA